jgi:hypothetical protein
MAGENVRDEVVRRVFASAIDVVLHLDRDEVGRVDDGLRRQTMEILAVVPSMTDDFSTEPIFVRAHLGAPLQWTGALPPDADRIERALPDGLRLQAILEGRVSPL